MVRFVSLSRKHVRTAAAVAAASMLMAGAQALAAQGIEVVMNQAKIVKLARPADTIVIGNPDIADASVQDATTIVLTGQGFRGDKSRRARCRWRADCRRTDLRFPQHGQFGSRLPPRVRANAFMHPLLRRRLQERGRTDHRTRKSARASS